MGSDNDVRTPAPSSASTVNGSGHAGSVSEPVNVSAPPPQIRPEASQSVRPATEGLPIWMQRTFLVIFVVLCIEIGIVLIAVPWRPVWSNNALLSDYPQLRTFMRLGFVRGVVTGIGLLDIWIGIWEAVHYSERKPA
jgi:hypothetical protein